MTKSEQDSLTEAEDVKLSFMKLSFGLKDAVSAAVGIAVFCWWIFSNFVTQTNFDHYRVESEKFRAAALEDHARIRSEMADGLKAEAAQREALGRTMTDIGRDVSYIRGRLEPKPK